MTVTAREIPLSDRIRERLPSFLRDAVDVYELHRGDRFLGITDEYGTCYYAAAGFTPADIEAASDEVEPIVVEL
jgi:hypothetical protein